MPLPKRTIEPVYVARSVYSQNELPSDLEAVTNTTLTNIVRQLSSLSKHSEDIFGELNRDANNLAERANSLQARIDRLSIKVTQLDSTVEEVSLTEIQLKKAFKSQTVFDQQIFSRSTMPTAMLDTYQQCDKPPPLDKLNCYRDDGKDGLKFYTDPNYFFELWRQEMLKDTERVKQDRRHNRTKQGQQLGGGAGKQKKQKPRQPHNTRQQLQQQAIQSGETLMPNNVIYRTPNTIVNNPEDPYENNMQYVQNTAMRPNSIEVRSSYHTESVDGTQQYTLQHTHYAQNNNYQATGYDEQLYQQQQMYAGGQLPVSSENLYAPGTPSRGKPRPSVPPPAPPAGGSGNGTPNASNAGTPTRRSVSSTRDTLPPPPPIPEGMQSPPGQHNGPSVAAKMLGRSNSHSRSGSPQLQSNVIDQNAMVMAQLNSQISNLQMGADLPPPPPIPQQMSPNKMMSPIAPPPPPPPPPLEGSMSPNGHMNMGMPNGDMKNGVAPNGMLPNQHQIIQQQQQLRQRSPPVKKPITPYDDTRSDLMKAIRDGIQLRKVERQHNEAREIKPPLDVASILARRVAIELSESESSDSDEDDEGWQEQNETTA
uniref:Wiskott-Aldrich syndrome protein family member n=1 Tax=Culicoides sonorensis TaxID=179676 RepID=A0A336LSH9_CULSO